MANRFWVGGTGTWNTTNTANWSDTLGGAGGASVPTAADLVEFSSAGTYTVTVSGAVQCYYFSNFGGSVTIAGTGSITCYGAFQCTSLAAWTNTGVLTMAATQAGGDGVSSFPFRTGGRTIASSIVFNGVGGAWRLTDALTCSSSVTVTNGTFLTNNFNLTATSLSSNNSNLRTINLGSSTVTLTSSGIVATTTTNLTFNAGTSSIVLTAAGPSISGALTFYNVSFTSTALNSPVIDSGCTFNNLSFAGRASAGISPVFFNADQTINGTLTLSAGTNATMRTFVRSNTIGTTRTLTCAAVASLTDIDFRDITIAGAAAPVSGTRLGDCKGNSGITFDAAKTVYWRPNAGSNWSLDTGWAFTIGGTASVTAFPLAQDTAVFPSTAPVSGNTITINAAFNIGTIDMSARTSNTMTLATGSTQPQIYGNWINGTGTTLSGTNQITFAGRGSQTITSAGKTFTQQFTFDSPGGSVSLNDAFSCAAITLNRGTFDAVTYNVTSANNISAANTNARTIAIGSGTWTFQGAGTAWSATTSTNLTVTGTGTISLTSASSKTFAGGGIQTYPTLNQGGTGTLTVSGSNKFAGLTNTAIGRIQFTGGTTNEFTSFTISGALGNLLQLGSTNTTQAILTKPTAWNMGVLSMDMGNNTGLNFLSNDGSMEYLSVSYINGQVSSGPPPVTNTGNFFLFLM